MTMTVTGEALDIGITARDPEKMLDFYRDFLGLEHARTTEVEALGLRIHMLRVGKSFLKLVEVSSTPAEANPPGGLRDATGLRYITINVASIDEAIEGVDAAGGRLAEPVNELGPIRLAFVEDPEGNTLELIERAG